MANAPGVQVLEKESFPAIQNAGSASSGMILRTSRGRDDIMTLVGNIDVYKRRFGGPSAVHTYGYEMAKGYFDRGGQALYVGRAIGAGAAKSTLGLTPIDETAGTAGTVQASSDGAWANTSLLWTQKYQTKITVDVVLGGSVFTVESVTGMEIGDVVHIDNGSTKFTGVIVGINPTTKVVTVCSTDNTGGALTVPAYASVLTVIPYVTSTSTHKVKTTLAQDVTVASPTQLFLSSAATVDKGSLLFVVSSAGDRVLEASVVEKNGNILAITVVNSGGSATIPAGSVVVSTNFNIIHQVDGDATVYSFLNLEAADAVNYAQVVLAQSEFLRFIAATATPVGYRSFVYPDATVAAPMTGGLDGSAPTAVDYLGTNPAKTYAHGMLLFDAVAVLPQFGIPGVSPSDVVEVQQGALAYAENRGDTTFIADAPELSDTLDELLDYRNVQINAASSYGALYAPWIVESDPLTPGAKINVPPTGKILGVYSEVSTRRGTPKPPANEVLPLVSDVVANFSEADFAILNDAGVNLIRNVSGRGVRVMGSRTLWPNADRKRFVNVRRILNSVKIGLRDFGVQIVQEPNDDLLWRKIQTEGLKFLEQLWLDGWFFPRNNPADAFFFACDATTNTEALRQGAIVRSVVGVNPVLPGELILFELSLFSGGEVAVNEL